MSVKTIKTDDYEKSIAAYFDLIKSAKSLTKKEEQVLWKRFHEHNDFGAREKLITANLKFVPSVAKQFKGCGLPFADIVEEGNIGLIKAIDRFNPQKDNKVISYAVWWIKKTILEAIEKKGMLDVDNIDDFYKKNSTDNEETQSNDDLSVNMVFDESEGDISNSKQIIEELFDGVPERERDILSDYFGLDNDSPKTLDEIGEELNLTKERIRQLNEKTLKKMRSNALLKNININNF